MNTRQITQLVKNNERTRNSFVGVFAADHVPKHPRKLKPRSYIANTDRSDKPGQHWVCLFFPTNGLPEFFDSYGFPPQREFHQILGSNYKYSKGFYQFPLSSTCGQYCIFYIHQRCSEKSMEDIVARFNTSTNLLENDVLVNSTVEREFNVDLQIFDETFIRYQMCRSTGNVLQICRSFDA